MSIRLKGLYLRVKQHINKRLKTNVPPSKENSLIGFADKLSEFDFDLVHFINYTSSKEALAFQRKSSIPTIYESYEFWQKTLTNTDWLAAERKCASNASAVIVVSEPIRDVYKLNSENDIKFFFCLSANVETAGGQEKSEMVTGLFSFFLPYFPIGVIFKFCPPTNSCIYGCFEN
jgi:hypothetical protein